MQTISTTVPTTGHVGWNRWRAPLLSLLLSVLMMLSGNLHAQSGRAGFYEDALKRFNAGEVTAAILQLKNALKANPKDLPARLLLGRAYLKAEQGEAAEQELRTARALGADEAHILQPLAEAYLLQREYKHVLQALVPGERPPELESQILIYRGHALRGLGQSDKAREHYVAAARMRPYEAAPLVGQASLQIAAGKPDAARFLVRRALALEPENADAWFLQAELHRLASEIQEAIESYTHVIERNPRSVRARIARAALLIDMERDQAAQIDIDWVRNEFPNQPHAAYLNSLVLARAGDFDGAESALVLASSSLETIDSEIRSNSAPGLLLAGVLAYRKGNLERARDYLQQFHDIEPYHSAANAMLGSVLLAEGDTLVALNLLESAARATPDDAQVLSVLGDAYLQDKQYSKAAVVLEKAATIMPASPEVRTRLAQSRIALGQRSKGREDLEAAAAMTTGSSEAKFLLAQMHLAEGDTEAGLRLARLLAERDAENPAALNLLGLALLQAGKRAEGRRTLERALAINSEFKPTAYSLAADDLRHGDIAAARARYEALLKHDPSEVKAILGLVSLALAVNDGDEASRWLDRIKVIGQVAPEHRLQLVDAYIRLNKADVAHDIAKSLEAGDAEDPRVLEAVARAEIALGKTDWARASLRRMARAAFNNPASAGAVLIRAGSLQLSQKDIDGARFSFEQALSYDSKSPALLKGLTALEIQSDNIDKALSYTQAFSKAYPQSVEGELMRGDVFMHFDRPAEAEASYAAAYARRPDAVTAVKLFRAKWAVGTRDLALDFLNGWLKDHPYDLIAQEALAGGYLEAGKLDAAIRHHEALSKLKPNNAMLLNNLAWLYQKKGQANEAMDYAHRAYALDPEDPGVLDTLGWVHLSRGEARQALPYLRDAYARASMNPHVRYHLALALVAIGEAEEARQHLEVLIEKSGNFGELAKARALLSKLKR